MVTCIAVLNVFDCWGKLKKAPMYFIYIGALEFLNNRA